MKPFSPPTGLGTFAIPNSDSIAKMTFHMSFSPSSNTSFKAAAHRDRARPPAGPADPHRGRSHREPRPRDRGEGARDPPRRAVGARRSADARDPRRAARQALRARPSHGRGPDPG